MTERDPPLVPFAALIGTWATEATHPTFEGVVTGTTVFDWLDGGHFVVQRSLNEHPSFPDAIGIIGPRETGAGLALEFFDSRGVRRTYEVSLDAGVLRIRRDHPAFAQRFTAALAADSFEGQGSSRAAPGTGRTI